MPIIGFKITEIEAKRGKEEEKGIKVGISPPIIKDVKKKKIALEGVGEVIAFEFEFLVRYEPIDGKISVKGEVLYEDKRKEEILKEWEKEKRIDNKILIPVLNFIFRKSIIKVLSLADDLQLPPPLRLPEVVEGRK